MHALLLIIGQAATDPANDAMTEPQKLQQSLWESLQAPLLVAVLLIAVIVAVALAMRQRKQSLAAFAERHGLQAVDTSDPHRTWQRLEELLGGSLLYKAGYVVKIDAWYTGRLDGLNVHVIDLREFGVLGTRREVDAEAYFNDERFADQGETFVVFQGEALQDLPRFLLVPNHPLLRALGSKQDLVAFENNRFNRSNRVTSAPADLHATEQLFTNELMEALAANRSLSIEATADALVFCRYATRLGLAGTEQVLEQARRILGLMAVRS
ncbi:MAG: hypothetical protein GVY24_04760 [Planctomycetes bacterium]|jgi:hypothetical protein|nr:hypothetical protein [Planctomycetota bacterium]